MFILISILIILLYSLLLLYYRVAWLGIPSPAPFETENISLPFVSVIISARNEELKIADCLYSLSQQHYSKKLFEVVVIDDFSEDNTAAIVSSFTEKFPNFKLVRLSEKVGGQTLNSYKKKAIETGISMSDGELIMTTDADCIVSEKWITTVASYYSIRHSLMIASPVKMVVPESKSWLQRIFYIFQVLDFTTLQGITGAALYRRFHYMSNGANLAYTKDLFEQAGGFQGVDKIASGDDMLLMDKVRMIVPDRIHYLKSRDSTVTTAPELTWRDFFNQRIRWASKSASYRDYKIKLVLALVYLVNIWSLILFFYSICLHMMGYFIAFITLKIIFELSFLYPVTKFFKQSRALPWLIILQPFHILYIIVAGWLGHFGKYKWKGRIVR